VRRSSAWRWIGLGEEWLTTGSLANALDCFLSAQAAADRNGDQRDLAASHYWIGDVLAAQGDLPGALTACRSYLTAMEPLAARDAGNTGWQRDLSVSLGRVADILIQEQKSNEARPLAERALTLVRAAIGRAPDDPRLARDLPYYENLVRRAGGDPARQ
jgi:tetratricopeptide (TPR) repeat protein